MKILLKTFFSTLGIFWLGASCSREKAAEVEVVDLDLNKGLIGEIAGSEPLPEKIDFNEHIRPIFNKNCTACHGGVNAENGKMPGDISLIYRDLAIGVGKSGKLSIIPGDADGSELYKRITSDNPKLVMPQPKHGAKLKQREIAIIKKWIDEGAEWRAHWSFELPQSPKIPEVLSDWGKNDIDTFILANLEKNNLEPSEQAGAAELLRRVSFDLVGLPPTVEQLDDFEKAYAVNPDKAYKAVVDRLLDSEEYGERWASVWLDLARYADSEGLGADRKRDMWPYRDWVIKSFNEDMPFDQFTIKQLAGDQLENPSMEDFVATGFHRSTQSNAEGGTDDEEFRVGAALDRVNTTWEVWQGQTFGCTQCHSHPYDTFTHKDYYNFVAFFNNDKDNDVNSHYPTVKVPVEMDQYPSALEKLKTLRKNEAKYFETARGVITKAQWKATTQTRAKGNKTKVAVKLVDGIEEIHSVGNRKAYSTYTTSWKPTTQSIEAIRLFILPEDIEEAKSMPENGSVVSRVSLKLQLEDGSEKVVKLEHAIPDSTESTNAAHHSLNLKNNSGWGPFSKIFHPRWATFVANERIDLTGVKSLSLVTTFNVFYNAGFVMVPKRIKIEYSGDKIWQNWRKEGIVDKKNYFAALNSYNGIKGVRMPVMQTRDAKLKRNNFVFDRGNWLTRGDLIEKPAIPKTFSSSKTEITTRLGMAKWLVSDKNPLSARVATNRYWHQFFGRGIVETLEDFGSAGMVPTNQPLLDHLAVKFQGEMKWSQKEVLRYIVSSATYQQTSAASAAHRAKDTANTYLSYGARRRLTAEQVIDMGLATSKLMHKQLYGKPTYPPIPAGVWKPFDAGDKWITPKVGDPQRYRRALYIYWKRSIPYPALMTFDAPSREVCSKRRLVSNSPIAALMTLNDEAAAEFAKGLARRMKYEYKGTLRQKIAYAYRIVTSHHPDQKTLDLLVAEFKRTEIAYKANMKSLNGLAGTADGGAYTILASLLLNLDATLTK